MTEADRGIPSGPAGIRDRIAALATRPAFTLAVMLVTTALMARYGSVGYLVGLAVALIVFWATRWDRERFGLGGVSMRAGLGRTALRAVFWVAISVLVVDIALTPVVERLTGEAHDYSRFAFLEGSLRKLLLFTLFMWVAAAFGEEFFFRGYVMKQLAELLGNSRASWIASIFLSAIPFGVVHLYQGWSGVLTTGAMGILLGTAFFFNRRNLLVCILAHGLYNMVGLTLIYLGQGDALQRLGGS